MESGLEVHIDLETYSEADLSQVGLYQYARHPSTEIELCSWSVGNDDVITWDCTEDNQFPKELNELLHDPQVIWKAFNAPFERELISCCWWIDIPVPRWRDVMIKAWALGFSGGLSDVGAQIGLPQDKQKLSDGRKLVLKFCKPAPKNRKVDRYNSENSPEEWARYKAYNAQDVVAEREIDAWLDKYPTQPIEHRIWMLDQRINERGLPVDAELINNAVRVNDAEIARLKSDMNRLTGLKNANSPKQLKDWVNLQLHYNRADFQLDNLRKETVAELVKTPGLLPDNVLPILKMRSQVSQTSTAKFAKAQGAHVHGRLQGVFQFAGAQRTQRWAGRLIQPHNLKQGYEDADVRAEILAATCDLDYIRSVLEMTDGSTVMDYLSNIMRTIVTAPQGKRLAVCDFGSIESRVLGYIANCIRINQLFRDGKDSYKDFASEYYHVDYDDVTKAQRKFSKPPVLGCGYMLGAKGLVAYAEGYGVELNEEESQHLVKLWRSMHPEVEEMWHWLMETCMRVTQDGQTRQGYGCTFYRDADFLFIWLPSGRPIAYHRPAVVPRQPPWGGEPRPTLTYMGRNQYNNKWERISTHGGKITENIVQAVARDLLRDVMLTMDELGMEIVGHVHDEVIVEDYKDNINNTLLDMKRLMSYSPKWAPDLLLGAEGFTTKRYRKD